MKPKKLCILSLKPRFFFFALGEYVNYYTVELQTVFLVHRKYGWPSALYYSLYIIYCRAHLFTSYHTNISQKA